MKVFNGIDRRSRVMEHIHKIIYSEKKNTNATNYVLPRVHGVFFMATFHTFIYQSALHLREKFKSGVER